MRKRITRIILGVVIILAILVCVIAHLMIKYALTPYRMGDGEAIEHVTSECQWTASWVDSLTTTNVLRDTFITQDDGAKLHAHWVEADTPTNRVAILVHGYKCQGLSMLKVGYMFHHQLGYNILMPDLSAHGGSDGEAIGMGWKDRLDVLRWMEVANELFRGDSTMTSMVVMGISMGAATTMCVSGEQQQPYVKAFIEDCGYTSAWDEFVGEARKQFGLPPFPLLYTASAMCKLRYGWSFGEASPLNQVKKCMLPMLFIHGDADDYVPTWMVKPLYEAKPQPKQLWITPKAEHDRSYNLYPDEYATHVRAFLNSCGI
ncbi:MAG: alpha/beta hydrolase [Muribaculaceae bacterium]|nr:alpha/beta hydrolase [Muribaculaceae bacterium]